MSRRSPLWLALRAPHLPLEACGHSYNSGTPVIISYKRRVHSLNALALAAGISRNMALSTAQSLAAAITVERDPEQEQQALQQAANICYRFTPYIEFYDEHSLLLEISRSLTLFRGVERLTQDLFRDLQSLPYRFHLGLAHTGKGAWLLSWQHHPISDQDNHTVFRQRLEQVPVDQLMEFPSVVTALRKSGFKTLGDLTKQMSHGGSKSSAAIAKRFGTAFAHYLDEIFGSDSQVAQGQLFSRPPEMFTPDDQFQEHLQFDYPIITVEQLREPMQQLLEQLVEQLKKKQRQCHSIQWRLYDIHQNREDMTISTERIHSQWQLPLDLTMIHLERTALPFEVDSLELVCSNTTPLETGNHPLLGRQINHTFHADSERLFARLTARLGEDALSKLSYYDDIFPENCQQQIAILQACDMQLPAQHLNAPRPSWLFDPPQAIQQRHEQLYWHGQLHILQGPERLQSHWWVKPSARDYFIAQRSDYLRCWIYQDLKSRRWYVHGVFG
jgi:protein ImuB